MINTNQNKSMKEKGSTTRLGAAAQLQCLPAV